MNNEKESYKKDFLESIDRFVSSLNAIKNFALKNDLTESQDSFNEIIRRNEIDFSIELGKAVNSERLKYSNIGFLFSGKD